MTRAGSNVPTLHAQSHLPRQAPSCRPPPSSRPDPTRQDSSRSPLPHEGDESGAADSTAACLPGPKRRLVVPGSPRPSADGGAPIARSVLFAAADYRLALAKFLAKCRCVSFGTRPHNARTRAYHCKKWPTASARSPGNGRKNNARPPGALEKIEPQTDPYSPPGAGNLSTPLPRCSLSADAGAMTSSACVAALKDCQLPCASPL